MNLHYYQKFCPKLTLWYNEALKEKKIIFSRVFNDFAIFPQRFYKFVDSLNKDKIYDFNFVGSFLIDHKTSINRRWIIPFIKKHFTPQSYLLFTDRKTKSVHQRMGPFDHTFEKKGFVPKEIPIKNRNKLDPHYYQIMCQSKFTLCPAGDSFYSMRFYEAIMCKSIPIVKTQDESFRSKAESNLDYKYYLITDEFVYREDWVEHNYQLFLKYHTFEYFSPNIQNVSSFT